LVIVLILLISIYYKFGIKINTDSTQSDGFVGVNVGVLVKVGVLVAVGVEVGFIVGVAVAVGVSVGVTPSKGPDDTQSLHLKSTKTT
jgi:hypothetical protein